MRSLRKLNYFLIGQPGAGKSTLGAQLAARLKVDFVDIDRDVLEADFGGPVAKQLVKLGHDGFMEAEAAATSRFLDTLTPDSDTVVSMTGSNPMDTSVMDKCVDLGELVYLDMPNDQLTERLLARPTGTEEIAWGSRSLNSFIEKLQISLNPNIQSALIQPIRASFTINGSRIMRSLRNED